jgi:hypothetical protein
MPRIRYEHKNFRDATMAIIRQADAFCRAYEAQGLTLSLRQLYYVFVSRDLIPNKQSEYKRLGNIISEARMAGLIDWNHLEDRGRSVTELAHWSSPSEIMGIVGRQYRVDKWRNQPYRPFVLIEKDALSGVFQPICNQLDIPFFACKGYASVSSMWQLGQRLRGYLQADQDPVIIHFGDHDPSGLDMTRDIGDRLSVFMGERCEVRRLALNYDQVQMYNPPPNPAKETDARFAAYADEYGESSWELDALEPTTLASLVESSILDLRDDAIWEADARAEAEERDLLRSAAERWSDIVEMLTA